MARSTDGSTWASLAERAITERRGGYDAWEQGGIWPRDVFQTLTGTPSRTLDPASMDEAALARQLAEPDRAMVASTREIEPGSLLESLLDSYDLIDGHAYSVRGLDSAGNAVLHNPWGSDHPVPVPMHAIKHLFITLDTWP